MGYVPYKQVTTNCFLYLWCCNENPTIHEWAAQVISKCWAEHCVEESGICWILAASQGDFAFIIFITSLRGFLSFNCHSWLFRSFVTGDWCEQLYPLIVTLKDSIGEVVTRAKQSMAFVLLQELACSLPQCLMLTLRRDIVFSQAVGASSIS